MKGMAYWELDSAVVRRPEPHDEASSHSSLLRHPLRKSSLF